MLSQFMNQTRQGMGMGVKMENMGGNPGMRPGMQPGMGGQVAEQNRQMTQIPCIINNKTYSLIMDL